MTKPIIVGYDPRRADHAPLEFGVAAAELMGAPPAGHIRPGAHARDAHPPPRG